MKKTISLGILAATCLLQVLPSYADWSRNYDGPYDSGVLDLNAIHNPPEPYRECRNKFAIGTPERDYCLMGEREAERMAQRFGAENGRVTGFVKGYARGMYNAFNGNKNDPNEMRAGAIAIANSGDFRNAELSGASLARGAAHDRAVSDAIERFTSVVNKGTEPSPAIVMPDHSFAGITNGYDREQLPRLSEEQMLREATNRIGDLPIYHDVDSTSLFESRQISTYDLWVKDGVYSFNETGWRNGDRAWEVWKRLNLGTRADYEGLPPREVIVRDPATGQVVRRDMDPGYNKRVYEEGFRGAYLYYVNYYFSRAYHQEVPRGYTMGMIIGEQVGKRFARQTGTISEYNRKYQEASIRSYDSSYRGEYANSFNATFADYMNSPKIGHALNELIGESNDGAYLPGERIKGRFTVENDGGVAKTVTVRLVGDVESGSSQNFVVPRLTKLTVETDFLAQVSKTKGARESARIGLELDGKTAYASVTVDNVAEIDGAALALLEPTHGSGALKVRVINPTSQATPADVTLTLTIDGAQAASLNLGAIAGSSNREVSLSFQGIDPLHLIEEGLNAGLSVQMNGATLHESALPIQTGLRPGLAQYFNELVSGKGTVPSGRSADDRIGELKRRIKVLAEREIDQADGNIWKDNPRSTIVGLLAEQFESTVHEQAAKDHYQSLGDILASLKKNVGVFKRSSYLELIKKFAPKINDSKKKS